jgi:DegV family protein with EDD domain
MGVQIITDSASDIIDSGKRGIMVLPLRVAFGTEDFLDGVTLSHEQFYEKLVESDIVPQTSQVSPHEFETAFAAVKEAGDTAVVITISKKLSGTYQSATIAAEDYGDGIYLVDSESVSVGERILVDYAIRLRDAGLGAAEIAGILEEKKKRICVVALLDTLEYLKKGGRISKAAAFAGGVLSIKPVIAVENGEVVILGKARGSKQGNNMLMQMIEKKNGIDFSMPVMLGYTGLSDVLLQKYIRDSESVWKGHIDELPICTIGGTIGTHAGPGGIAVAFFQN